MGCKIFYNSIKEFAKAEEKKEYLRENKLQLLPFEKIQPDKKNNWINIAENDFEDLTPIIGSNESIFNFKTIGVSTNRDEWVYEYSRSSLRAKFLILLIHIIIFYN